MLDNHGLDELVRPLVDRSVYHLSMRKIFETDNFEKFFADGSHLFPAGHERIAAAVVEQLRREGLVGPAK